MNNGEKICCIGDVFSSVQRIQLAFMLKSKVTYDIQTDVVCKLGGCSHLRQQLTVAYDANDVNLLNQALGSIFVSGVGNYLRVIEFINSHGSEWPFANNVAENEGQEIFILTLFSLFCQMCYNSNKLPDKLMECVVDEVAKLTITGIDEFSDTVMSNLSEMLNDQNGGVMSSFLGKIAQAFNASIERRKDEEKHKLSAAEENEALNVMAFFGRKLGDA